MPVECKAKITVAKFYVAKDGKTPLLSYETAKELGLIRITVAAISADDDTLTADQITKEYPKLFQGLGKLRHRQVKIHIDTSITPVALPQGRIPFHGSTQESRCRTRRPREKRHHRKSRRPNPMGLTDYGSTKAPQSR